VLLLPEKAIAGAAVDVAAGPGSDWGRPQGCGLDGHVCRACGIGCGQRNDGHASEQKFFHDALLPDRQAKSGEPSEIESTRNFIDEMFCASAMIFSTARCANDT
jgi:hypothetical protein